MAGQFRDAKRKERRKERRGEQRTDLDGDGLSRRRREREPVEPESLEVDSGDGERVSVGEKTDGRSASLLRREGDVDDVRRRDVGSLLFGKK